MTGAKLTDQGVHPLYNGAIMERDDGGQVHRRYQRRLEYVLYTLNDVK
jgi:hypothetical protein